MHDATTAASRGARFATRVVFLAVGVAMSAWAPLVPYAKARSGLDEASLGLVLLCLGAGSLVAMPLAGRFTDRHGCRRVILSAGAIAVAMLPMLASTNDPLVLAATLFVFGAGLGTVDVAMNLQAIVVERASGRAMMSGFHAMYSIGGIGGASGVAAALAIGTSTFVAVAMLATLLASMLAGAGIWLLTERASPTGSRLFVPRGVVLLIGLLGFAAFLIEGAVLDWSAVFLTQVRDVPVALGGAGYIAFSITMTIGRFVGDRIVRRFGASRVLVAGALVAAVGTAVVALVPAWPFAIAGFALVGAGCANIVPVLFSAAGRQKAMPASVAVPAMTTMGYAGLLAGPALIGFVASLSSLQLTFVLLALMMGCVALAGRRLPV